jgi:predicted CoA-binding protein
MTHDAYPDLLLRRILRSVNVIATVGASANWVRPSHFAMKYLQAKGFRVIPVNPTQAGAKILGERVYASLPDIPEPVDMVQVFRRGEEVGPIARDAIAIGAKVLWTQLGIRNDEAARLAETAGLTVIMNRCPKIEYGRLSGELGWSGINTGVISSKRRQVGKR